MTPDTTTAMTPTKTTPPDDGGPAFPATVQDDLNCYPRYAAGYGGMSLRDWFAGQAITAAAMPDAQGQVCCKPEMIAKWAYDIADAMLAVRNVSKS